MEKVSGENIRPYDNDTVLAQWQVALQRYNETGASAHLFMHNDEAQWDVCLTLLQCHEIESDQIIEFSYENHADYHSCRHGNEWKFDGAYSVNDIVQSIADVDSHLLTFPNDFRIVLKVLSTTETVVEVVYESSTSPVVCADCRASTDPVVIEDLELNPEFSCMHADDELSISMSVNVTRRAEP